MQTFLYGGIIFFLLAVSGVVIFSFSNTFSGYQADTAVTSEPSAESGPLSDTETRTRLEQAEVSFQAGDYANTVKLYEEIIARNGGTAELYRELGHYYRYWYKFPESETAYLKSLELNTNDHWTWTDLAKLYRNMQAYDKAEIALDRSIELNPTDDNTYSYGYGYLYLQQNRFGEAQHSFEKALELNPESDMALTGLGDVASRQGMYEEAEAYYQRALDLDPFSEALYSLGMMYLDENKLLQAEDMFQFYLKNKNERAEIYLYLGITYDRLGKTDDAYTAVKKAVLLNPDNEMFQSVLREIEKQQ